MAIGISSTASFLIGIVFDIMKRAFGTRKRKKFSVEAHEMETKKGNLYKQIKISAKRQKQIQLVDNDKHQNIH